MNKFVDSDVIIFAFTEHKFSEKCKNLLLNQDNLFINTLVLIESYSKISIIANDMHAYKVIKLLLSLGNLNVIDLTSNLFFESIKRSQKHKLKISDLAHYTTALLHNCNEIISYDKHFDELEIKRVEP